MISIKQKPGQNTINIPSVELLNQVPPFTSTPNHRNIFTAKLRPRTMFSSGKASKLQSKGTSLNNQTQAHRVAQSDYKPRPEEMEGVLHQFDNLQLQDFLKMVIVGKSKLSQAKSKQIIRSLNGTWFKNTDSNSHVNRLYCSLPIRKQRSMSTSKITEEQRPTNVNFNQHFYKNYTPPNLFPKRKISPLKNRSTLLKPNLQKIGSQDIDSQIQKKIVQKFSHRRESANQSKRKRRPSSYFSNNKQSLTPKFFDGQDNCLVGKKMLIHD